MPASITISKNPLFGKGIPYCTGGTVTTVNGKRVHTFTAGGTLVVVIAGVVEYLVVAGGGGGGGGDGGGGGAGGLLEGTLYLTPGNKVVTVGGGGAGGITDAVGSQGQDSVFDSVIATKGGGGGAASTGTTGGSGGGGSSRDGVLRNGSAGTAGQGFDGGNAQAGAPNYPGGGGGGAAAGGGHATTTVGGGGGGGKASSISGASVTYAGGGGGGTYSGGTAGGGGAGGGGAGSNDNGITPGVAGTANTGGGGGGGSRNNAGDVNSSGGNGGSGIVIVSYPDSSGSTSGIVEGGAVDYLRNLRPSAGPSNALAEAGTFSNYSHKIRGLGGFWQCSFVWHDELSVLMEMMAEGWVRDILVMGERGMETWEGFVAAMELSLSGGMPSLKVTGYGYFRTLFWRVYNQTASGHVDATISGEVATIVTAAGPFITSAAIEGNYSLVDRYHDGDRFAGDLLFDMCAAGDIQNHRFLVGCYENTQLRYEGIAKYQVT